MKRSPRTLPISIVIPTYGRGRVLLQTLQGLLNLAQRSSEIVVCDQTLQHEAAVEQELESLESQSWIRRLSLARPSIPGAMNKGLLLCREEIVVFVDDDIVPGPSLLEAHFLAHRRDGVKIVAGQVLQPGEEPTALVGADFAFHSSSPQVVPELMAGNFSIRRSVALALGGFDENFVGAAYRFEREFSERAVGAGLTIVFVPQASIRHLRAPHGGTRSFGNHLSSFRPAHSVGEYYYILVSHRSGKLRAVLGRLVRSVKTRHHLHRPWWVPVTLMAELSGLVWATLLVRKGPRYLTIASEVAS